MNALALALALVVLVACDDAPPIDGHDACHGPASGPHQVGTVTGVPSTELSGLAVSATIAGVAWSHGDHGGAAEIYAIDTTTAAFRGTLAITGATNEDWEDIATAPCGAGRCIYIADIGDNQADRATIAIYEVTEPDQPGGTAEGHRFDVRYPDGPHNAEALIVDPRDGASYVITKTTGTATAYRVPRMAGTIAVASPIAMLSFASADPRITGAAMAVDACEARILVRTYGELRAFAAAPDADVATILAATPIAMPVADEPQGEAVAFDGSSSYLTVSEGISPALWRVDQ